MGSAAAQRSGCVNYSIGSSSRCARTVSAFPTMATTRSLISGICPCPRTFVAYKTQSVSRQPGTFLDRYACDGTDDYPGSIYGDTIIVSLTFQIDATVND